MSLLLVLDPISREGARELARTELRRREYDAARPPLLYRVLGRVLRAIGNLLDRAATVAPGGRLGVLALGVLLALLAIVVLTRLGPLARSTARAPLFSGAATLSADQHRTLADTAAGEGRYADAVRERLRAVVRELELRGALDVRPGRTAGEVAADGGRALPAVADDLRRAAGLFDQVWYGGRTADAESYDTLVQIDERVRASRLTTA